MKTLKGINERPQHFNETAPAEVIQQLPTYKRLILDVLGLSKADSGAEAIDMFALGQKIRASVSDDFNLEDAEYNLLKSKVELNPSSLSANYFAQLVIKIKEAGSN